MDTYISLEAAKGIIRERGILGEGYSWREREEDVCDMLDCVAIADVAHVKHGKWIETEETYEDDWGCVTTQTCTCSACGYAQKKTNICAGSGYIRKSKFCPECGAKMEGAE